MNTITKILLAGVVVFWLCLLQDWEEHPGARVISMRVLQDGDIYDGLMVRLWSDGWIDIGVHTGAEYEQWQCPSSIPRMGYWSLLAEAPDAAAGDARPVRITTGVLDSQNSVYILYNDGTSYSRPYDVLQVPGCIHDCCIWRNVFTWTDDWVPFSGV